jgi:hypothetical protein
VGVNVPVTGLGGWIPADEAFGWYSFVSGMSLLQEKVNRYLPFLANAKGALMNQKAQEKSD